MPRFPFTIAIVGGALAACRTSKPPAEPVHGGEHPHSHHAHSMQHRFEQAEDWVARFDDPGRDAWQKPDQVIAALGLRPDDVVADVGAGTGYFTVRLARAVATGKVYASDVEPDMVRHIGERAKADGLTNVVAIQGSAGDPRLPEPVDVVLMVDVLHHVTERPAFFRTLAAALDEGGRVVVVDFKPDAPEDGPGPPRRHRLAIADVERDAASAGLRASVRDVDTLPFQYVLQLSR